MRHYTGMRSALGPLLTLLMRPFSSIKTSGLDAAGLRSRSEGRAIVYLFFRRSLTDYLILNWFCLRDRLPLAAIAPGLWKMNVIATLRTILGTLLRRGRRQERSVFDAVMTGDQRGAAALFLNPAPPADHDYLGRLLGYPAEEKTPVLLVPVIFVWSHGQPMKQSSALRLLTGDYRSPGVVKKIYHFLVSSKHLLHLGQPFELPGEGVRLADFRNEIYTRFSRELLTIHGPEIKPREWIIESILSAGEVAAFIEQSAAEQRKAPAVIRRKASDYLHTIVANLRYPYIEVAHRLLKPVFRQIFTGLTFDRTELERVRELARDRTLIFVPSHKSHVDYLLLSYLLFDHGLAVPHIAAGDNLSFWPMGHLFRNMGAFFIKRSFTGNRLYRVLMKNYLKKLIHEGYGQEFFIEGGRSRTGKLLFPKLGLLSMYAECWFENPSRDICFVPVSIVYEKLIEEKAYSIEAGGGEKRRESLLGLMRVLSILRLNFGRVHLRIGEPLGLAAYAASRPEGPAGADPEQRRALVSDLGFELVHRINQACTVTPLALVACVLLTHNKRGITSRQTISDAETALAYLERLGVNISRTFRDPSWSVGAALEALRRDRTIAAHLVAGITIDTVDDRRRLALDFHKNGILHYFLPASIGALAFVTSDRDGTDPNRLSDASREISRLFKHEFVFGSQSAFAGLFGQTLDLFSELGVIRVDVNGRVTGVPHRMRAFSFFAGLLKSHLETYLVAATNASLYETGRELPLEQIIRESMQLAQQLHLIGDITRTEAISQITFRNAFRLLGDEGVLTSRKVYEGRDIAEYRQQMSSDPKLAARIERRAETRLTVTDPGRGAALAGRLRGYLEGIERL